MKRFLLVGWMLAVLVGGEAPSLGQPVKRPVGKLPTERAIDAAPIDPAPADVCSATPKVVEIREADLVANRAHHDEMRSLFVKSVGEADTTVLLGPNVVLDFTTASDDDASIEVGRCVTIKSVASFLRPPVTKQPASEPPATKLPAENPAPDTASDRPTKRAVNPRAKQAELSAASVNPGLRGDAVAPGSRPDVVLPDRGPTIVPEARGPFSLGPWIKFGPRRSKGYTFITITCAVGDPAPADHVRISGFRLHGPSMGQQEHSDTGIRISGCVDVEISNMEIAGWGGVGVRVQDGANEDFTPQLLAEPWQLRKLPGACREPPYNGPTGRIGSPSQVRIFGNHFHHNQHPRKTFDGGAAGYGVAVYQGAWAQISRNLFSHNRHAIAASGTMGGYEATDNLVLRYGGIHYDGLVTVHTHAFDIHGTGDNGFKGFAGSRTTYEHNAFQYRAGAAISIRGSPRCGVEVEHNVFASDDAVKYEYREDDDVIKFAGNEKLNTYGRYGVCDFDADGIDDLFLATGASWWFSGGGEFPWRFLSRRPERLGQVRLGYFDSDNRCDVLTESGGRWHISSGGTGLPYAFGDNYAPLSEVHFGRFDPNVRDRRAGVTRATTHALWRQPSGQWRVAPLTGRNQSWRDVQSSAVPMNKLRFGDFTGDGVTDVLSVQGGRWAISQSATGSWKRLNPDLGDDVSSLYFADLDHDNIDDILRLQHEYIKLGTGTTNSLGYEEHYEWQVSYGGRTKWQSLDKHEWRNPAMTPGPKIAFAGRFGTAPGGGVLLVDAGGNGRFYSPGEAKVGAKPSWKSLFQY